MLCAECVAYTRLDSEPLRDGYCTCQSCDAHTRPIEKLLRAKKLVGYALRIEHALSLSDLQSQASYPRLTLHLFRLEF